jgi:transposase-like protein
MTTQRYTPEFKEEERNGVPKQELATAEQDLGAQRRENARLREENELLKKAAIYFAEASSWMWPYSARVHCRWARGPKSGTTGKN